MCSETLNPGGAVQICSVGCILGAPEISPFVIHRSSYQVHGVSRTKEMLFQAGSFGCGEVSCFLLPDKHDRRYVSVRVACGFTFMKVLFPDACMANEKGAAGGITILQVRQYVSL